MWRVMIADDEPKIQRGLRAMVEGLDIGAEVVGLAEDGEQALGMAKALMPDILLVDICMPFLNGLELIEALEGVRADIRILVVTGFETFDYARRALAMHVHAYLLKPVEEGELRAALLSAMDSLESARKGRRYLDFAMRQLERRRDILAESFLREAIQDRLSEEETAEQLEFFGLKDFRRGVLLLLRQGSAGAFGRPMGALVFRYALEEALRPATASCRFAQLFTDARGNVLLLADTDDPEGLLRAVREAALEEQGILPTVLHAEVRSIAELSPVYDALLERLMRGMPLSPAVEAAKAYIAREHTRADLGLPEVAEHAGVAPSYLSRLMKQELGLSFSKFLSMMRINRATALMADPHKILKDISEEVGYASPYYFSTAFKKLLGISPNEYRNQRKEP